MPQKVVYCATGRRKEAVARVRMVPGKGNFLVNERKLEDYFPLKVLQMQVRQPFKVSDAEDRFDVSVNVCGGGIAGQAGAVRHGVARALVRVSPDFRLALKKAGLLTRDPRMKERRKYGLKKARKAPQYSKR